MEKTTENKSGVIGIVHEASKLNSKIGTYKEHFINENFVYVVRLSNGRLTIPRTMAHDFEVQPSSISGERLMKVANSYQYS